MAVSSAAGMMASGVDAFDDISVLGRGAGLCAFAVSHSLGAVAQKPRADVFDRLDPVDHRAASAGRAFVPCVRDQSRRTQGGRHEAPDAARAWSELAAVGTIRGRAAQYARAVAERASADGDAN